MAALELKQKQQDRNLDFDPVTLEDGTVLTFTMRQSGKDTIVRCSAKKNGREIGYGSWNTKADRFTMYVEPMSMSSDARALAQAIHDGIIQILDM